MFDKFSLWWQGLDTNTKKIIFVVVVVALLAVLSFGLISLNNVPKSKTISQSSSSTSSLAVDENVFTTAPQLKKIDSQTLLLPQRLFFNSQNQPIYVGDNLKLTLSGQKIEKSPEFILRNV